MTEPQELVREILRLSGIGTRGDKAAVGELDLAMHSAEGSAVPDMLKTSGHAIYRALSCAGACARPEDRCERSHRCVVLDRLAAVNRAKLASVAMFLKQLCGANGEPPVVLGDAAVLLGLYRNLGAFRGQLWIFGVKGKPTGEDSSDAVMALSAHPSDVKLKRRGPLRDFVGTHTFQVEAADNVWEVPKNELLITALAARVGDPDATPLPPVWAHLCVALVRQQEDLDMDLVRRMAEHLELNGKVERGLAVAARILPELEEVVGVKNFDIPLWEKILAIPISARRLLNDALGPEN